MELRPFFLAIRFLIPTMGRPMEIMGLARAAAVLMDGQSSTSLYAVILTFSHRLCQHRLTAIAGAVGFRNTVGYREMTNWFSPSSQRIAYGRGMIRSPTLI
jgi:hypothetical protein